MSLTPEQHYEKFLQSPLTVSEKVELESQIRPRLIADRAFDGELAFGTGGMRAVTGLGTNRLNLQNVARLNLAVAEYFKKTKASPLLAMGYDSRLTSPQFSRLSYHILKGAGMRVKVFRRPTPTPLLSFAVRELGADCGVILTASHNPPQYNGYKAYGADGGQIISPVDKDIQKLYLAVEFKTLPANLHALAEAPIAAEDLMEEEIYAAYMARLKKEVFTITRRNQNTRAFCIRRCTARVAGSLTGRFTNSAITVSAFWLSRQNPTAIFPL
jgi:phosphomannomutase